MILRCHEYSIKLCHLVRQPCRELRTPRAPLSSGGGRASGDHLWGDASDDRCSHAPGTGSPEPALLRNGNLVYAAGTKMRPCVPRPRLCAGDLAGFRSVAGRLGGDRAARCQRRWGMAAGQAFHWFEPVCDPGGSPSASSSRGGKSHSWNSRRGTGCPSCAATKAPPGIIGTDYRQVDHKFAVNAEP